MYMYMNNLSFIIGFVFIFRCLSIYTLIVINGFITVFIYVMSIGHCVLKQLVMYIYSVIILIIEYILYIIHAIVLC